MPPTIRDVARHAGVSVATVSRVLNGTAKVSDTAKKAVLKSQKELGFYLNANARALAQKDGETIGVLVSELSDPYFGTMVKACEEEANCAGKSLLVAQGFHNVVSEQRAIENLLSHQCSGLVIHGLAIADSIMSKYMERVPYMVLINRVLPGFEDRCVNINNFMAMYRITEYLIQRGHKKIAFVNSSHHIVDASERLSGFVSALNDNQLMVDPDLIVSVQPSLEGGAAAAQKLLEAGIDRYSAVACYNDALAAACMSTFINQGVRVPEQISFTGFDNLFLSSCLNPGLTTVNNPVEDMGRFAIRLSLSRYKKNYAFKVPEFETELIVRNSVRTME